MYLAKKILMMAFCVLLAAVLTSCGGDGGGSPASTGQTIKWQLDGNGFVKFFTNDPQWIGYTFWDTYTQTNEAQMTTVTATVVKQSGSPTSGYGILFCYQDTNNFYRLLIDANGGYCVYAKVGGTYTAIIPWTQAGTALLNSGFGVANEITVTQQSLNNFSISFNGTQETAFGDANFTGGRSGFCICISPTSESFPAIPEDARFKLTSPVGYPVNAAAIAGAVPTVPGTGKNLNGTDPHSSQNETW
jgi:hypothetical protein